MGLATGATDPTLLGASGPQEACTTYERSLRPWGQGARAGYGHQAGRASCAGRRVRIGSACVWAGAAVQSGAGARTFNAEEMEEWVKAHASEEEAGGT